MEPAGVFVPGQPILAVFQQLGGQIVARVSAFFQDDMRFGFHQPVAVFATHDACLEHLWVVDQSGFDLDWRTPDPSNLDHVV